MFTDFMAGLKAVYVKQQNQFNKKCESHKQIDRQTVKQNEVLVIYTCISFVEFRAKMQIFIKTIDDKILSFEMEHSNKISDVKIKIREKTKLPTDQQNLFFNGELMNDCKTSDEYQIYEKCMIDIITRLIGGFQIFVKLEDGSTSEIEVEKSTKIIDLKKKIQLKFRLHPEEQKLIYQAKTLDDDEKTIGEYEVVCKAMIYVVGKLEPGIEIFARTSDDVTVVIGVQRSDKIIDIKKKIQEKIGLHPDEQRLIYRSERLKNEKTISENKIDEKSVIDVIFRKRPSGMKISAKTDSNRTVALEVEKSDKIIDIKYKIQYKIGLHPHEQILKFKNEILNNNDKSIDEYQICDQSVITVVKSKNEIRIFIKLSDKTIIPIYTVKSSRIIDVKLKIEQLTGMQFVGNNLVYENYILHNEKLLTDYQIDDGCVISIDSDSQFFLFLQAIKSGSVARVEELYDDKYNSMSCSVSPIHFACKQNNADVVEFLIAKQFDIDSFDNQLKQPIHYACINGCQEVLETLIQHECRLEDCDSYGMKPIHLACLNGNIPNIKLLIENNCDLESEDYSSSRPIHLACLAENIDILKILIENKCKIDVFDKSSKSPLDIAGNCVNIVEMLNNEISIRMVESMITELDLKCNEDNCDEKDICDHKFCPISLRNKTFQNGERIGRGAYGDVYKQTLSHNSRQIAIKQISIGDSNSKNIEGNINCHLLIKKINHERIIKYFGAITKEENIFIFMEFMNGGSLRSKISTCPPMTSDKVYTYTIQILEGLQFLHSNKIIHRDIKPDNILLDNVDNAKLSDFGLGLLLGTNDNFTAPATTFCGTPYYMAPEIISGDAYSYGADIWSLGVTVIEMATGKRPYHDEQIQPQSVMYRIASTKTIPYQLPESYSSNLKQIIHRMLDPGPFKRPTATELINNLNTMI